MLQEIKGLWNIEGRYQRFLMKNRAMKVSKTTDVSSFIHILCFGHIITLLCLIHHHDIPPS